MFQNSAHLLPPRKACLFPLSYKVLIHFHNPLVARCSSSGYMSAASGSEDPCSNQIQILLSQKVWLQRLGLYENHSAQNSNSFPKKKIPNSKEELEGREVTSLSEVCVRVNGCVCVFMGDSQVLSAPPSFLPSRANRLPLHFNYTHIPSSTRVTPSHPTHPTPNQGCSQIPESQTTCPLCSHNLSFSVSVVKNIFLCLLMKHRILLLLLCK